MNNEATVKTNINDNIALITLNRPKILNAMNGQMRSELLAAAQAVNENDGVRIVILAGEGKSFCAGADIAEPRPADYDVQKVLLHEYRPILAAITAAPKPWISMVQGAAAGIGSAFAMNCDLTVMSTDAYMYQAFAAISLVPDGGTTWHLTRTLGRKKAYEVMVSGEKITADQCLAWGLCNRVVSPDALITETVAWARQLAEKAPLSLRHTKSAVNAAMEMTIADTMVNEARLQSLCMASSDFNEGVQAFTQKRAPQFTGQ